MPPKETAAQGGSGVGPSRRTWDVAAYSAQSRAKDRLEKEAAEEAAERARKGKAPLPPGAKKRHHGEDLPKPTESLQARGKALAQDLQRNTGKSMLVDAGAGQSKGGPGYYCELCRRTCKDSIGYLDHVNGRSHLRRLGQTTQVSRSSVEDVRAHLAALRARLAQESTRDAQQGYDFQARVAAIAEGERREREARKARRREAREAREAREREAKGGVGVGMRGGGAAGDHEMMSLMGFGGFGSTKR